MVAFAKERRVQMTEQTKDKLLCLQQIIENETDSEHALNSTALMKRMDALGFSIDRRTIYRDVEHLREAGCDIVLRDKQQGYYYNSRLFELTELKLMAGMIAACTLLTPEKIKEMIDKLCLLASRYEAMGIRESIFAEHPAELSRAVWCEDHYAAISEIFRAIEMKTLISYVPLRWNIRMELMVDEEAERETVKPLGVFWEEGRCYLAAVDKENAVQRILVEQMGKVRKEENSDLTKYSISEKGERLNKRNLMKYGSRKLELECETAIMGDVINRFGRDFIVIPCENGKFRIKIDVPVTVSFFGWIAGLGGSARITWPQLIQDEFRKSLRGFFD